RRIEDPLLVGGTTVYPAKFGQYCVPAGREKHCWRTGGRPDCRGTCEEAHARANPHRRSFRHTNMYRDSAGTFRLLSHRTLRPYVWVCDEASLGRGFWRWPCAAPHAALRDGFRNRVGSIAACCSNPPDTTAR